MLFKLKMLKTNFLKRIISFFCVIALITINFSGCGVRADEWVKKFGEDEINLSEFLLLVSLKVDEVENQVIKQLKTLDDITFEDIKETEINGASAFDYLKDLVEKDMNRILAYRWAAKNLKISLNAQEIKALQKDGYNHYKSFNESFNAYKLGISLQACENYILWRALEYKVGEAIVQKGQVGEVTADHIKNFAKNKDSFAKYESLKIPKNLKELSIEDPNNKKDEEKQKEDARKNEEERKKEEAKKKEEDEKKIKKHFGVETGTELAEKLLKKVNDEKKTLAALEKETKEALKELKGMELSDKVEYMNMQKNEYEEYKSPKEYESQQKVQKEIKTMQVNGAAKIVKDLDNNYIYIIKLKEVDDETIQKEENKIRTILQEKNKKKYINDIQKKHENEIEANEDLMNVSIIEKQVKKVLKNKVKISSLPTI